MALLLILICILFLIWWFEPRFYLYLFQKIAFPIYTHKMFLEPKADFFKQIDVLELNKDIIVEEVTTLLEKNRSLPRAHHVDAYNNEISNDTGPGWQTFYLKVYDGWFAENCELCPKLYQLLKTMDDVITIMISVMEPGNSIPAHRGKLRGFIRYQLPLLVPTDGTCQISVGNDTLDYQQGVSFLFDDNNTHSVVNLSSESRVVLFLDIRKKTHGLIRSIDRLLMKLVTLSPKFKKAKVYIR